MDPHNGTSKWESVRNAFASATKNGWGALKLQALMRGTFIREHIVPTTVVTRDQISSADDGVSKCLFPRDTGVKHSILPVKVVGDGNCFYRSVSNSIFGTESNHVECRVRCVHELVTNFSKYTSHETYTAMSSKPTDFKYIFESSISDQANVPNNVSQSLKNEIMNSTNDGQYSSLLHLYATANAFKRPVVSIFPQIEHVAINRSVHNQTISPLDCSEEQHGPPLYIMWTHTSNVNKEMWQPNHFVSCHEIGDTTAENLSSGEPPPKKQKISDYFRKDTSRKHECANPETSHESDKTDENFADSQTSTHPETNLSARYDFGNILNGTVPLSSLSQSEKIAYVESSCDEETLKNLPFVTKFVAGKEKKVYFQAGWLNKYKWLTYSSSVQGGLCKTCMLFPQSDVRCYDTFVSKPFTNFKKVGGKDCSFLRHEQSAYHKNACIEYQTLKASLTFPETTVQYKINSQNKDMYDKNLRLLRMIVESVILCGKQNIPLRGHRDDSTSTASNKGNFWAILNLLASHDKELADHLKNAPKNATYTSKTIQNEIIDIIGSHIRNQILEGMKGKGIYSIIADEVTDTVSNQEVLALCVRFLDESQNEPYIREEFFDFLHLKRTTGKAIANKIVEVLTENNIPVDKMRGQAYDGAAAMSSEKVGCQAQIKSINPLALYTHCNSHVLNLSIAHACKIPLVRNMIDGVNATFVFFDVSPKRQRFFEHVLQHHGLESKRKKLLGLCKTRWVERHTCYDVFYSMYTAVVECLRSIVNPAIDENTQDEWSWDAQTKITAQGLLATMMSYQFLVTFICVRAILQTVKPLASKLQKHDLDVYEARTLITGRVERVKEMREGVDAEFETWYQDCKTIADELEIEEKVPRTCGRQTQRTNIVSSTPQQYYKRTVAVPFLDHLSAELNDRFNKEDSVAYAFGCLVPKQMVTLSDSEIQNLSSEFFFWESDLQSSSSQDLLGHLLEWKRACEKFSEKGITADNLLDTYRIADGDIFPDIKTLLHIGCTLPVTSCEAERSFSGLRRIKSYMRSTMNEDRLSSLALMHLHHARTINASGICQKFVMQNKRRMFKSCILNY